MWRPKQDNIKWIQITRNDNVHKELADMGIPTDMDLQT